MISRFLRRDGVAFPLNAIIKLTDEYRLSTDNDRQSRVTDEWQVPNHSATRTLLVFFEFQVPQQNEIASHRGILGCAISLESGFS